MNRSLLMAAIAAGSSVAVYGLAGALRAHPALPWAVAVCGLLLGLLCIRLSGGVERVDRAAVRHRGVVFAVDRPGRHNHAFAAARSALGDIGINRADQGFITTRGRFVDREEAARIVLTSGQLKRLKWAPGLYSEDLW